MKLFNRIIQSLLRGAIMFIAPAVAGLSSCNGVIYEDLDPCPEGVRLRFVYDYNLEFANAFPSQVDCLTVLINNEDGTFRESRTITDRNLLADEDWRLIVDLPEGKYKIIAYGGIECRDNSFHFVTSPEKTDMTSLEVALNKDIMDRAVGTDLHKLFWGTTLQKDSPADRTDFNKVIDVEVKKSTTSYDDYTVYMMRDTNNLRVVLQELSGAPVNDKDFRFAVIDDNTLMGWDNAVIPTAPFSYKSFYEGQASTGLLPDGSECKVAFAEFSFGRLVTSNQPILHITRASDGSDVVKIPLINYLLLTKSEALKMSNQEFLDRENQWNMTFFLDKHWKWIYVDVEVQDWVVRVNNSQL